MMYSIGITTYDKRYEKYLKKLIISIRNNIDHDIILAVNGNFNEKFNSEYRKDLLSFVSNFENIYPIFFPEFRSLSKLWNTILIHSTTKYNLILNDDLIIDDIFWKNLKISDNSYKINGSWSHIFLNREEINEVGWFDERFLGIGEEDGDFEYRYFHKYKKHFNSLTMNGIINCIDGENALTNQNIINNKYSKFNYEFCCKKYNIPFFENGGPTYKKKLNENYNLGNIYPIEDFYWKNKNKL